jgi:hypothetical protein
MLIYAQFKRREAKRMKFAASVLLGKFARIAKIPSGFFAGLRR